MNLDYYTDTKVDGSQEDKCCQVKGEFVCQRNGSLRTTSGPAPHRCQDAPLTALGDPELGHLDFKEGAVCLGDAEGEKTRELLGSSA